MHVLIALFLSTGIGVSLGLIGGGGSIITVPVLVYALGLDAHQAVAMSLAVVGATSVVGAALHARHGTVDLQTGMYFGLFGIAGALVGSRLSQNVSSELLLVAFAMLMLVIAAIMLVRRRTDRPGASRRVNFAKALPAGFAVGVLTGFLGVGGGFLVVPALVLFGGLAMKDAVGTSLVVIAINCAAGLVAHLQFGGFDPWIATLVTAVASVGVLFGAALSHRIRPDRLRTGFAVFVVAVAVFLLAENARALL